MRTYTYHIRLYIGSLSEERQIKINLQTFKDPNEYNSNINNIHNSNNGKINKNNEITALSSLTRRKIEQTKKTNTFCILHAKFPKLDHSNLAHPYITYIEPKCGLAKKSCRPKISIPRWSFADAMGSWMLRPNVIIPNAYYFIT